MAAVAVVGMVSCLFYDLFYVAALSGRGAAEGVLDGTFTAWLGTDGRDL